MKALEKIETVLKLEGDSKTLVYRGGATYFLQYYRI